MSFDSLLAQSRDTLESKIIFSFHSLIHHRRRFNIEFIEIHYCEDLQTHRKLKSEQSSVIIGVLKSREITSQIAVSPEKIEDTCLNMVIVNTTNLET